MKITDGRSNKRDVLEAYRLRAIELRYKNGYSVTQISEIFGIHYNSVSRWFGVHRKSGTKGLMSKKAPGAAQVLEEKHLQYLSKTLIDPATKHGFSTPLWNGTFVRILLQREQKIKLDRTTIWRYLIRMGLSFQKPETRYSQQDQKLVKKWIRYEWPKIQRWAKENRAVLYFEDESGISLAPIIGKTWSPRGQTPIIRISGKRGGVLAMSAISPGGRMVFRLETGRINSDVIIDFLKQIKATHPNRKIGVIMDQAPCHVSKKVKQFSRESKTIKVFYLPPYSPELNPDEKVWRQLKHVELKNHQSIDKQDLQRNAKNALRSIQKKKLAAKFFDNYLT